MEDSGNFSLITLSFLTFGVLLFQLLSNAMYNQFPLLQTDSNRKPDFKVIGPGREIPLPGFGILGDSLNNGIEDLLNVITVFAVR